MKLKLQKRLATQLGKVGKSRVKFSQQHLKEIKEALTKSDVSRLMHEGIITISPSKSQSRHHARKLKIQKRKGRRQGHGSREGKRTARLPRKQAWMARIRIQRRFLKLLKAKNLLSLGSYRSLYLKAKSGAFRSKRHIKIYITEQHLAKEQHGKN
ncbi:MAG TPA: 50S ribosomal protein L19e [Candidatus Nanoarchaeia archaeon]|nr:50S ribosomal protein L19e [Candidatus Nanoarchaeia archaeon]